MDSHADRIGWLEADVQTFRHRLQEVESSLKSDRWDEQAARKKLKSALEDEMRELRSDLERMQSQSAEYRRGNEQDKHSAFSIVSEQFARQQLAIWVIGAISFIEAIAIIVLWRR